MKRSLFLKIITLALLAAMMMTMAACGGDTSVSDSDGPKETNAPIDSIETVDALENDDLSYVMVYNPAVVNATVTDSTGDYETLDTGYFGNQIDVDFFRGDELDEVEGPQAYSISMLDMEDLLPFEDVEFEADRADLMVYDYKLGDVKEFYAGDDILNRDLVAFECVYAGENCYIWSDGSINTSNINSLGEEFDSNIYPNEVEMFGQPRFVTEDGGKVNILLYDMGIGYDGTYLGGYFCPAELFTEAQLTYCEIMDGREYSINTDHAIIHINIQLYDIQGEVGVFSTIAHEFQHLINGSDQYYTVNEAYTNGMWINEAMSGFIEEYLYPGAKERGYQLSAYDESELIRYGQSLYNFATGYGDIGVYGSVYYYTEYLADLVDKDVFNAFHTYWRESYSTTLCDAEAIAEIIPSSTKDQILNSITYPDAIKFASENDELMSKLTLDFYLNCLNNKNDVDALDKINKDYLLYDSLDGTEIEAGGRVIVSVADGKFEAPTDADDGLIYVGLDSDFNVIGFSY